MDYYKKNAKEYIESTINADMKDYYSMFLGYLNPASKILDIGFGSGRDSLYFSNLGYEVFSLDPIEEFCAYGRQLGLNNVILGSVEEITYEDEFDALWACASLLHIKSNNLINVFNKCYDALKDNGVMFVSFKYGDFEGMIDERYFTYLTEQSFSSIMHNTKFRIDKLWINESDKLNRNIKWLNAILIKEKE